MILTGDYHYGDIKALQPGPDTSYADWYASQDYKYPIYQARVRCERSCVCVTITTEAWVVGATKSIKPIRDSNPMNDICSSQLLNNQMQYTNQSIDGYFFKVMSSGMTVSTAEENRMCEGPYVDEAGLRPYDECSMVLDPNFGFLKVVSNRPTVAMWKSAVTQSSGW